MATGYGLIRQADGKYVAVGRNFGTMIVARFDDNATAPGRIGFTNAFGSAAEADGVVRYTVRRTGGRTGAVSVDYETSSGEAEPGLDFESISGTLSWHDGETDEKTLTIDFIDDDEPEGPETFTLSLADPTGGAALATSEATSEILSEDGPGEFGFLYQSWNRKVVGTEGRRDYAIVERRSGSEGAVSVSYSVTSGTATEGEDFVLSGTLSWADGDSGHHWITINNLDDLLLEGTETYRITLDNPTGGATLHGSYAFQDVVIRDRSSFGFLNSTVSTPEQDGVVTVEIKPSGARDKAVSVEYSTSDGSATAGSDYTSTNGTLTWAAGEADQRTIEIPISDDALDEADETFYVTLGNPSAGVGLATNTVTVTIVDNDSSDGGSFEFVSASVAVSEQDSGLVVTIVRNDPDASAASVEYSTSDGSATAGSDYTSTNGTLTWAAGEADQRTIEIPISDDALDEADETFSISLANPTGQFDLGPNAATTVTIVDNDLESVGPGGNGGGGGGALTWLEFLGLGFVSWFSRTVAAKRLALKRWSSWRLRRVEGLT